MNNLQNNEIKQLTNDEIDLVCGGSLIELSSFQSNDIDSSTTQTEPYQPKSRRTKIKAPKTEVLF